MAESADAGESHGLRKFVEEREVGLILGIGETALCPADEQVGHFLRADATGNAFAAGFVAIEADGVEGHVEHASSVVANHDGAGAKHGAGFCKRFEIETNIDHRGGKIARGWTAWSEGFQFPAATNSTGVREKNFFHGGAHGDFKNAGIGDVTADADKFQSARTIDPLRCKPFDTAGKDLRHVDEGFDIVEHCGFLE